MRVTVVTFYAIFFLIASICSAVLCNNRRSEGARAGSGKEAETPFWAARGKRSEGVIRCGIVRPGADGDGAEIWSDFEIPATGGENLDELASRLKRSAGSAHYREAAVEPIPLWLTRPSLEMDRPGYQPVLYPSSRNNNERLLSLWRSLQEKRADRAGEKANSETAPFWAARG